MFILHGWKEALLSETIDRENACLMCKGVGIHVAHYQRYYHFFFLPTFPIGKSLKVRCLSCGATQERCATTALLQSHRVVPKAPIKYWAGTFLILIVGISIYSIIRKSSMDTKAYISNPLIGDIYTYEDSVSFEQEGTKMGTQYFKVYDITPDSIYLIQSNLAHTGYMSISKVLEERDLFTDRYVAFSRTRIIELYNEDKISSVHRPKTVASKQ